MRAFCLKGNVLQEIVLLSNTNVKIKLLHKLVFRARTNFYLVRCEPLTADASTDTKGAKKG